MQKICPSFDASTHRDTGIFVEKVGEDGQPYLEEVIEPIPPEEIAAAVAAKRRKQRDAAMSDPLNILSRHRNQKDFGLPTTLTDDQATGWAIYLQGLRDYPETGVWPDRPE